MMIFAGGKMRMRSEKGCVQAGSALLCCLLMWTGAQIMPENAAEPEPAVLCKSGVYTLYAGMTAETYAWPLYEKEQDTGYLFCAEEGTGAADGGEKCISMRRTVGGYVPLEGDVLLQPDALYALCEMRNDYPLQEGVRFYRGYMTRAEQDAWRAEAIQRYEKLGLPAGCCPVPEGGKSEHQLGLAVDVKLMGKMNMTEKDPLKRNPAGQWLAENMWQYGFVYDGDFSGCEGIHLRYVGRGHARMMHLLGMNMQEYLTFLQKNKTVTLMHGETMIACVQCVTEGEETVLLPQGMRKEISRDNRGNIILYCWAE